MAGQMQKIGRQMEEMDTHTHLIVGHIQNRFKREREREREREIKMMVERNEEDRYFIHECHKTWGRSHR